MNYEDVTGCLPVQTTSEEEEGGVTRKMTGGAPIRAMAVDSFLMFPPL